MADSAKKQIWVVLLRGINVNPTTKLAMAELRSLLTDLGYEDVVTLLQSGNVLLSSTKRPAAAPIEAAIVARTGVPSRVVVLALKDFAAITKANPLLDNSAIHERDDLSKMVITFLDSDITPSTVDRPSDADLEPERLVITKRAIYQWCPDGILKSQLKPSWWRQFDAVATTRNVRTVNRILAASEADLPRLRA
jgi:uncharacterized protein (DUF1697 family)